MVISLLVVFLTDRIFGHPNTSVPFDFSDQENQEILLLLLLISFWFFTLCRFEHFFYLVLTYTAKVVFHSSFGQFVASFDIICDPGCNKFLHNPKDFSGKGNLAIKILWIIISKWRSLSILPTGKT